MTINQSIKCIVLGNIYTGICVSHLLEMTHGQNILILILQDINISCMILQDVLEFMISINLIVTSYNLSGDYFHTKDSAHVAKGKW